MIPLQPASGVAIAIEGVGLAIAEAALPRRERVERRTRRWPRNVAVSILSAIVERVVVVPAMLAVARRTGAKGRGIAGTVLGLLALDWGMYLWHRANHRVGFLWKLHAHHHSDRDVDASTAARFHPGEVLLSTFARCAAVAISRASPRMVLAYETAMQASTLFHHSNLELPRGLDRVLVKFVVTPRMHGIHHARTLDLLHANWGTVSSMWDRIHRTLRLDADERPIGVGLPPRR